jgi:hypothetical protein
VGPSDQSEKKKGKGHRLLGCCGRVGLVGLIDRTKMPCGSVARAKKLGDVQQT